MKILIVKLTSMGDALHLLPVLSVLQEHMPDAQVDWVIEDNFAEIPAWHAMIRRVIPVSTRHWRTVSGAVLRDMKHALKRLRHSKYDIIIDAQGLMKSALIARCARLESGGQRVGFSKDSIKETPAAWFYSLPIKVAKNQHAIDRLMSLVTQAFKLPVADPVFDYGLAQQQTSTASQRIVFLHGTTWASKHLPDQYWRDLRDIFLAKGYEILLAWGNEKEQLRANWIAQETPNVRVLDKSNLAELKSVLQNSAGAISVDTGLGHLAAAVGLPNISIYGSTNSELTGAIGKNQTHIQANYPCSPCLLKQCNKLDEQQTTPPCYSPKVAQEAATALMKLIT